MRHYIYDRFSRSVARVHSSSLVSLGLATGVLLSANLRKGLWSKTGNAIPALEKPFKRSVAIRAQRRRIRGDRLGNHIARQACNRIAHSNGLPTT